MFHPTPTSQTSDSAQHPTFSRRFALQAGAVGLLGLGTDHLAALRSATASDGSATSHSPARAVIFIFLSGGLAQHESFDPKPDAPEGIRGEFRPIATHPAGRPHLRAPPAPGAEEPALVAGPVADPPVERSFGGPPHHAHRAGPTCPPGSSPNQPQADRLALDGRRGRGRDDPKEQPAPGDRVARAARSQHRTSHPRPVRRRDGAAPGPLVHRGVAVRPDRLWGLSRIRIRPPGSSQDPSTPAVPGPRPDASRRAWRRPACRPSGPPRPPRPSASRTRSRGQSWPVRRPEASGRFLADGFENPSGVRRRRFRPQIARPLRSQRVRMVALDRRGDWWRPGSRLGAGKPGEQRDVGHTRQRLPAPQGPTCSRQTEAGRSRRCWTTWTAAASSARRWW